MATAKTMVEVFQESGCDRRGCDVGLAISPVRHAAQHTEVRLIGWHDGENRLFAAVDPTVAEQITAWLREKHR